MPGTAAEMIAGFELRTVGRPKPHKMPYFSGMNIHYTIVAYPSFFAVHDGSSYLSNEVANENILAGLNRRVPDFGLMRTWTAVAPPVEQLTTTHPCRCRTKMKASFDSARTLVRRWSGSNSMTPSLDDFRYGGFV